MASQIELELNNTAYISGSDIKGDLVMIVSKQERIKGININLSGQACTGWELYIRDGQAYSGGIGTFLLFGFREVDTYRKDVCGATEEILKDTSLRLCDYGDVYQVIPAGVHRFPFQFWLPARCPSSFESQFGYGSIRYMLTATVWKANKTKTMKWNVVVNDFVDANLPRLIQPQTVSDAETVVGLCSCITGTISLSVTTDRKGYRVGESIAITVKAKNNSRSRVTAIQAFLEQRATFFAYNHQDRHVQHETKIIQKIQGPGIRSGDTGSWVNKPLVVPPTIPSITFGIIKVSYCVSVVLVIRFSQDFRVAIPITIGNAVYNQ